MPRAIDAQNAVRPVIAQSVRGLENRSVADLKRVWPSLAGSQERAIQAEFGNARSVKAAFNDPQISHQRRHVDGRRFTNLLRRDTGRPPVVSFDENHTDAASQRRCVADRARTSHE